MKRGMPDRMIISSTTPRRRGAVALIAMLFLVLLTTLAVGMYSMATMNVQSAQNLSDLDRARAAAESGLRWQAYRFVHMDRPHTTKGAVTSTVADGLWPAMKAAIIDDHDALLTVTERGMTDNSTYLQSVPISVGDTAGPTFTIRVDKPVANAAGVPMMKVTSTATYRGSTRTVAMNFEISKKVRYAVVGKVPIQLGRNTIVEGPVAMATANKFPPLLMLSDFMHFDPALATRVTNWNNYLEKKSTVNGAQVKNHNGYDNRISVNNTVEYNLATAAGYKDVNKDAFIDEYDLFVDQYDKNKDLAVTAAEFTNPSTGKLYDDNLFKAIDSLGAPMTTTDPTRVGYKDNKIDNTDGYAKLRGQIELATTASAWSADLAGQGLTINDMVQGMVASDDPNLPPVTFGASSSDIFDLSPQNFEACAAGFRPKTGPENGTTSKTATVFTNVQIAATDANGGTATDHVPYGSTTWQATYKRPVFKNITFKNCRIPKGINGLFDNCKFEGVTFIDMEHDITKSTGAITYNKDDGMTWSQKMKAGQGTFSKDTVLTATNSDGFTKGNNVRFNNCTFEGPLAGSYATAYTHFTNSWEFTGSTLFNNKADETATIVAPQTNIEMGSFTDPSQAPSTLIGVVVAGNIDIRGTSTVDGSIIVTGDGAGNTTLAYFGASDADTNPGANPEGGYGRLNIRYNPTRALPDGIDVAVDVLPTVDSYTEGTL